MATQQIKDILNAEVPQPSFVLSPSVPAPLPSGVTVTRNGQDNVARTLDPYSGKFEHVPEDTPRVYGADQSLLVEPEQRTNHVLYSSDFSETNWVYKALGNISHLDASIINNEDATLITGGGDTFSRLENESAGNFSSGPEAYYAILEKGSSPKSRIKAQIVNSTEIAEAIVDWPDESVSGGFQTESANFRLEASHGPNGGKVAKVQVRYDASTGSVDQSGSPRTVGINPDYEDGDDSVIVHHTQLEEAANSSSPIVTNGSAKTRAEDDYTITAGAWQNPNQATFLITVKPLVFETTFSDIIEDFDNSNLELDGRGPMDVLFVRTNDDNLNISDAVNVGKFSTLGLSITGNQTVLSVNGESTSKDGGSTMLDSSEYFLGKNVPLLFASILYYPRALRESTLNTLTS